MPLLLLHPPAAHAAIGEALRADGDMAFQAAGRDGETPVFNLPRTFAQDGEGFLWAGSNDGLFRWDGYAVARYLEGARVPDGLPDHDIGVLHTDPAGVLWVGTRAGGLARYDAAHDHFVPVPLVASTQARPGDARINDIADDGAGGLLIATADGLFRRDASGRVTLHQRAGRFGLPGDDVRVVLRGRDGRVWIGGSFGLAVGRPDQAGMLAITPVALPRAAGAAQPVVSRLVQDAKGALWVGTHEGAFVLKQAGTEASSIPLNVDALAAREVMTMAEIRPGEVWIGTYGEGIVAAHADGTTRHLAFDAYASKGLDSNVIFSLFRDRSGIAWVSTPFGISHADIPPHSAIVPLFDHPAASSGLTVEQPTSLLVRRNGDLWIGSEENGIEILDPDGRQTGHVAVQPVVAMAEAPDGRIFAGGRGGIYVISADGRQVRQLQISGRADTDTIWALSAIGDELWVGGDNDGVWVLHVPDAGPATVLRHLDPPWGLASRIVAIRPAGPGQVAIASGGGLWLVDQASGAVRLLQSDPKRSSSLPSNQLSTLAFDRAGRLWVGTADAGLAVLTGWQRGVAQFARIGLGDGLGNPDVDSIVPDGQGRMWVSTDSGIVTIDQTTLRLHSLGIADGVAVGGYWQGSQAVSADGDILFGGTGGLTVVRPDLLVQRQGVVPVAITHLTVGGQPRPPGGCRRITLEPGARSLSVEFASLDFADSRRNRYRYRLHGFDPGWIETDAAHRVAAYTNLRPGHYVLELSGSDHDGVWSPSVVRIAVDVRPAWDETVLFKVALAAAVLAAFVTLLQLRTRWLRLQQGALEREVAERTAALRASEARLERLAHLDALTGLPNRRAFNNRMATMCQDPTARFALAILDVDGFKEVNDNFGHDAGDTLLDQIGKRLRSCVGPSEFVARLGGDEFAILLHDGQDAEFVARICERILAATALPVPVPGQDGSVGSSIGIALYPADGTTPDALYKSADLALYAAKRAGRGTWRRFSAEEAATV